MCWNLRSFLCWQWRGIAKWASFKSTFVIQSPGQRISLTRCRTSILKDGHKSWELSYSQLFWCLHPSLGLHTGGRQCIVPSGLSRSSAQIIIQGALPGCLARLQAEWFYRTELESQGRSARSIIMIIKTSRREACNLCKGCMRHRMYYYPGQKKRPLRLCIKSKHCSYHAISAWSGDWHSGTTGRDFAHRCTPKRSQAWFFDIPW